ncbi:hydrogenase maturation protease [Clostridium sp. YIM B02515]|uniref:Hydrogenase maturation protease n=1 Tax=Clostridium rhizosphaerae TaxID=2803861 RepID=A0ABS1T8L1_9CLOT|nr:hydrogenase maturation protease [Clostridium rhizosphaerae]MBL4935122.1 hydrogenase maturation protease [Clostridium rhizosphaerae]
MSIKLIAVGNRLMGDEGIAIKVAEYLLSDTDFKEIEIILGETDIDYCISKIKDNDILFILDAALSGRKPGSITTVPISKYNSFTNNLITQHDLSLLRFIKYNRENICAFLIGIEVERIDFSLSLSLSLEEHFDDICHNIKRIIKHLSNYCINKDLDTTFNI